MKFRKKPVIIEAEQYTGMESFPRFDCLKYSNGPYIETLEGPLRVSINDWIIKGIKGEFYPCKPDIFEATYEKVE